MVVCFMTIMIVFNSNYIIRSSTPALHSCCLEMLEDCVPRPGVSYRKAMQWSQTSHKTRITRQIYWASSTLLSSLSQAGDKACYFRLSKWSQFLFFPIYIKFDWRETDVCNGHFLSYWQISEAEFTVGWEQARSKNIYFTTGVGIKDSSVLCVEPVLQCRGSNISNIYWK